MRHINLPNKKYYIKLVIRNDPENRDGSKNTHKQLNDIRILIHYIPDTYMRSDIHFIIKLFTSII